MKKRLIILIISTISIIILLLGILIFFKTNKKDYVSEEQTAQEVANDENMAEPINNNAKLFTAQGYIQSFIEQINVNNVTYYTGGKRIDQSIISKWTYSLLSTEYIDRNSITEDNVYNFVNKIEEKLIFVPLKINILEYKETTKYAIYGFTQTQTNQYKEDVYFILNVDNKNNTYSIEPVFNVKSIDEIKLTENNLEIKPNRYNSYKENEVTDENICEQYLNIYKRIMLAKTEESYNYLNEEYRNKKFGTLQDYAYYVANNKDKIAQIELNAYSIKDNQYICKDQGNNYYIFNIKGFLDYDVILDTYTVDLPEFIEKYNKSNEQEKVVLNINKIMTAINAKDYKYVYSKLADSFKNNYYPNEESLTQYLEDNMLEKNIVTYKEFSQVSSDIYTYKIKVSNGTVSDYIEKTMNIVIQLKEGTDFVMSFTIEK